MNRCIKEKPTKPFKCRLAPPYDFIYIEFIYIFCRNKS